MCKAHNCTNLSSSQGLEQPVTTMLGRKRFIGTGWLPLDRMRLFRSAKLSVVAIKNGCPSANDTTSDTGMSTGFSDFHFAVMSRLHVWKGTRTLWHTGTKTHRTALQPQNRPEKPGGQPLQSHQDLSCTRIESTTLRRHHPDDRKPCMSGSV